MRPAVATLRAIGVGRGLFVLQPWRQFRRRFFTWHGYRDGLLGFGVCALMAYYEVLVCRHLWGLQRERAP
ncbi:MAG: hypothetical protein Q9O62_15245 [Ardenticatenia bacterium]|nr:hypothetical protein [Ardenticatenia bacterium]